MPTNNFAIRVPVQSSEQTQRVTVSVNGQPNVPPAATPPPQQSSSSSSSGSNSTSESFRNPYCNPLTYNRYY